MKTPYQSIKSTIKSTIQHKPSRKHIALFVCMAIALSAGGVYALQSNQAPEPKPEVQSVSTTMPTLEPQSDETTAKPESTNDTTPAVNNAANTATKPSSAALPPTNTASKPAPAPSPTAPPLQGYKPPAAYTEPGTFYVSVKSDQSYLDQFGQVVTPFTIDRVDGYSLPMDMPSARIIESPAGAVNIGCDAHFKDNDFGFITIYGPDDAPGGTYGCEVIFKSGFISRVATVYFTY